MPASRLFRFGPFSLDADRRVLSRGDQPIAITARAFDLLLALLARAGQTVEKEELLRVVWPDTIVEEANLSQQIFNIRKLLGQTDDEPYITTVPRRGYRFVAPVRESDRPATADRGALAASVNSRSARLEIPIHAGGHLAIGSTPAVAVSTDGSRIVYAASDGSTTRLYLRPVDSFSASPVAGTEGATSPFLSPDGDWIGFQCGRRLQKVPIGGGTPLTVCELAELRGATWSRDGHIVYAPGPTTGLWRVPAAGGTPTPLTTLDFDGGERTHRWPHTLPDGDGVIFTIGSAGATSFDEGALALVRTSGGSHRLVMQHATDGRCLRDGRLVWARGAALLAASFDLDAGRADGGGCLIQDGVAMSATGVAHFAVSDNGLLVHVPGAAQTLRRSLVTINRDGTETGRYTSGESLEEPRFSPDGSAAIVSLRGRTSDLWLYDFARGALGRLTFDGENFAGIWGPGTATITFSASRGGASDLYQLRPDRSAPPELLVTSEFDKAAGSWSPDGSALVFTEYHPESGADLWIVDRASERARPFVVTRFNEYAPVFSPDGRHVAYVTDESGRAEVVVVTYPEATGKRQLSTEGGTEPVWSHDATELFYRSGERLMRVDMGRGVAHAGIPTTLFEGHFVPGTVTLANYDVSADASQFLMVAADAPVLPTALRVTLGNGV